MSEKLQQDHFKVAPKKHDDAETPGDDDKIVNPNNILLVVEPSSIQKTGFLKMKSQGNI
ncbi:MAG: hypothetical protein ACXWWA_05075 [Chitinophagaceae bacterium]